MTTASVLFFCISTFLVHDDQDCSLPVCTSVSYPLLHLSQPLRDCTWVKADGCADSKTGKLVGFREFVNRHLAHLQQLRQGLCGERMHHVFKLFGKRSWKVSANVQSPDV